MSRRKQARPIRHLDQESSEEEGGSKVNVGKKKSVSERKVESGGEDGAGENRERRRTLRGSGEEGQDGDELRGEVVVGDEGKGGKPVNGRLKNFFLCFVVTGLLDNLVYKFNFGYDFLNKFEI